VIRCWWGYLPGTRCRLFAYGPADDTAIPKAPSSLASFKSRLVLPFWYRLIQAVVEKEDRSIIKTRSNGGLLEKRPLPLNKCIVFFL